MADTEEPDWLTRLRGGAHQRPRTQFQRIRWADLQQLLRERDFLLHRADDDTQAALGAMQQHHYGRGPIGG